MPTTEVTFGSGVAPLLPPAIRRARLLAWQEVDVVIDVGANAGQYASQIREAGYRGRIVSFEPLAEAFESLTRVAADDAGWECRRLALGSRAGRATLNVSRDLEASSILAMEERHVRHWPPSAYVRTESVRVARLDALMPSPIRDGERVYLKLDVQGYEHLEGPLYRDVVDHLATRGFHLASIEGITEEPETGHMLQHDGIFVRSDSD